MYTLWYHVVSITKGGKELTTNIIPTSLLCKKVGGEQVWYYCSLQKTAECVGPFDALSRAAEGFASHLANLHDSDAGRAMSCWLEYQQLISRGQVDIDLADFAARMVRFVAETPLIPDESLRQDLIESFQSGSWDWEDVLAMIAAGWITLRRIDEERFAGLR